MKFFVSIVIVGLFLSASAKDFNAQVKNPELEKLEAQLKLADQEPDSFDVEVDGDNESSGKIKISAEREVFTTNKDGNKTIIGKAKKMKLAFPTIDLSKVEVSDEYINEKIKAALPSSESIRPKCGVLDSVWVAQEDVSRNYIVMADYLYNPGAYTITVLKGFTYDRASIPRILWVIIDKDSLGNVAPLIHDLLYRNGGVLPPNQISPDRKFSRKETDGIFLEIMEKCGVSKARRELAYKAVRKFGICSKRL